jgi:hypothetical protein
LKTNQSSIIGCSDAAAVPGCSLGACRNCKYYECLDDGEAQQIKNPTLLYMINMQEKFAAVRVKIIEYTLPVAIPKNTSSPYGNSDESDGGPPSPKMTDATEKSRISAKLY